VSSARQPGAASSRVSHPAPAIAAQPLDYRTLALTGAFETDAAVPECFAGLSGNFDGQGISFGALQWNLGQGTLQPLLRQMDTQSPAVVDEIFGPRGPELRAMLAARRDEQLAWAVSIQDRQRSVVIEPWRGLFKTLGRRGEFQVIQTAAAQGLYERHWDGVGPMGSTVRERSPSSSTFGCRTAASLG